MDAKAKFEELKEQWGELSTPKKAGIAIGIVGMIFLFVVTGNNKPAPKPKPGAPVVASDTTGPVKLANPGELVATSNNFLATSPRNMGLEDQSALIQSMRDDVKKSADRASSAESAVDMLTKKLDAVLNGNKGATFNPAGGTAAAGQPVDLNKNLPPPVDFSQPGAGSNTSAGSNTALAPSRNTGISVVEAPAPAAKPKAEIPPISLPRNTIIESIMLSGINARTNSAGGTSGGNVTSANNVGSPFLVRVKGNAYLPNGWKVADLDNCFMSGEGVGILSTEKANVISSSISCVDKAGRIFEAKIKAFGVDEDGIQGISGRLVTKQGSILAKMALAGIASGLGSAFTPQATASFTNTSGQPNGSSQAYVVPNAQFVAGNAVGQGLNQSMTMLSKFYLDYAKQMFPVIEVNAGTRVTWILQEGVDLVATTEPPSKQSSLR